MGYKVFSFSPDKKSQYISGAVDHKTKEVLINKTEPIYRQCFTAAHEIAHIVLHGDEGINHVDYREKPLEPKSRKEQEADFFAANLLMPEEVFKEKWSDFGGDFSKLSGFFGVSKAACAVRSSELNVLS